MEKITDDEFLGFLQDKRTAYYKIAFSYVKNQQDALDVIQEATCKAYMKKGGLRDKNYFNTWFVRILINTAIATLRSNQRYAPLVSEEQVSQHHVVDESQYDLVTALQQLDVKYRSILILKFYEDMTFKEIGQVLRKPESTVKTNYYKAIDILKGQLCYETV